MATRIIPPARVAVSFGQTLKAARLEAKLTQEELAERSNLSVDAVSLLERGKRVPVLTTLYALADALDISVAYLVGTAREKLP